MGYKNMRAERIGKEFVNKEGCVFKIIEYTTNYDIVVMFLDEYGAKVHTKYQSCENGNVKNPYYKSVCGVGCLGLNSDGTKPLVSIKGKQTKEYKTWTAMIDRCYNENHKWYCQYGAKGVFVDERWLVYANFLEDIKDLPGYDIWIKNDGYSLDKDELSSDVVCYSKETCQFIHISDNVKEMRKRVTQG